MPIIALQLNAFQFADSVVLHFTKVLDVFETLDEEEDAPAEQVTRGDWEKRLGPAALHILDAMVAMVPNPRVTYNKFHIALGTTGYNFCWFHPRRTAAHCLVEMKVGEEKAPEIVSRFEEGGLTAHVYRRQNLKFKVTQKELTESAVLIKEALAAAERWSRSRGDEA